MSYDVELALDVDTGAKEPYRVCVFDWNVTYNLSKMWHEAGWDFDAVEGKPASEVRPFAEKVLENLLREPHKYMPLQPANGWGDYDGLVDFFTELIKACREHPKTILRLY